MSRTLRLTPDGSSTRDGHVTRSTRRPRPEIRRQGTRDAVIAAALADYALEA